MSMIVKQRESQDLYKIGSGIPRRGLGTLLKKVYLIIRVIADPQGAEGIIGQLDMQIVSTFTRYFPIPVRPRTERGIGKQRNLERPDKA